MKWISVAVLSVFLASSASAGGDDWKFRVEKFSPGKKGAATLVLRAAESVEASLGGCEVLTVHVAFKPEPFWRRTWSSGTVSRKTHADALELLRKAEETQTHIRFGSMGHGVVLDAEGKCVAHTRGLAVFGAGGEEEAVYGFHDPI